MSENITDKTELEVIGFLQDAWIELREAIKVDDKPRMEKAYGQVGTFAIVLCSAYGHAPEEIELLLVDI